MMWTPDRELEIPFNEREEVLYRAGDPSCAFHEVRWPLTGGRATWGEFPLVVTREHFRRLGYTVWASEPLLPDGEGFILLSYPGKRRSGDPAYRRMEAIFGAEVLAELNDRADAAKKAETENAGGGDPDLFVFRGTEATERFFVEVKHRDRLNKKQMVAFRFVEELCQVRVARLVAKSRVV